MSSHPPTTFALPSGSGSIPAIGLGTYLSKKGEVAAAVEYAVRNGYRHLDLAYIYGNQREVGEALKKVIPSVVKREELFITTKLWNTSHKPEDVSKELDKCLQQLSLDYVDLYLMHWPIALEKGPEPVIDTSISVLDTWRAMGDLLRTGKVKNIGVSNFTPSLLRSLIAESGIKPSVNQVELHPYLHQDDLLSYCAKEGIHVTAYFPLGGQASKKRPSLLENEVVKEVAKRYNATSGQLLINWGLKRGYSVIPKSITPDRIKSNFRRIDLSPEDTEKISNIGKGKQKRFVTTRMFKWDVNLFDTDEEKGFPAVTLGTSVTPEKAKL